MQALVAADKEPIRPFITRVRSLWTAERVSTILVVGGSGDYFDVADTVLLLDEYKTADATAKAKELAAAIPGGAPPESKQDRGWPQLPQRCLSASGLQPGMKLSAMRSSIRFGDEPELDLSAMEQIVEHSQVRAIAEAMVLLAGGRMGSRKLPVAASLAELQAILDKDGLDALKPGWRMGNLAAPRMLEVGAAFSRLRSLEATQRELP